MTVVCADWCSCHYLEALESGLGPLSLVWHHAADDTPQDAGRSAVVPRTSCGVSVGALADERGIFHYRRDSDKEQQTMTDVSIESDE